MKQKILILSLLALICMKVQAQDTVRYGDSNYFFMPLDDTLYLSIGANYAHCHQQHNYPYGWGTRHGEDYLLNHVSEPMLVYGIAFVSPYKPHFYFHSYWQPAPPIDTNSINLDFYAMLAMKESDNYYHVDSAKWYPRNPNKYFEYENVIHECAVGADSIIDDITCPVYEFYFKTPQIVVDTFLVGLFSTSAQFDESGNFICYSYCSYDDLDTWVDVQMGWHLYFLETKNRSGITPVLEHCFRASVDSLIYVDSHSYYNDANKYWGAIFPIIMPPDTDAVECIPVQNFRRTGYVDGRPLFAWDRLGGQQTFQISYGPADQDPDSHRVVNASVPPFLLPDRELDSTVLYAARCRARCHHTCPLHDTIVWSPWSDTVQFFTGSRPAMGIGLPTADAPSFTLSPNPVRGRDGTGATPHGQVTVTLSRDAAPPCVVTLRDEQGRTLQRHTMEGRTLTLATGRLAAGLYLVTLDTPQGSSTQKLVVE